MSLDRFEYMDDAVISFFGKGVVVLASIFTALFLARFLGPTKLGEYFFTLAVGLILSNVLAGFGKSVIQHLKQKQKTTVGSYFTTSLLGTGILSVLMIAVILGFGFLVIQTLPFLSFTHLLAASGVTVSVGFFEVIEDFHMATTETTAGFFTTPLRNLGILLIQIPLVILNFSIPTLIFAFTLTTILASVILVFYSGLPFTTPQTTILKETLLGSFVTTPVMLLGNLFGRIDIFIIGIAATTTAVGYYEAAYRVLLPGLLISASASRNILAHSNLLTDGKKVRNELKKAVSFTGFLAIPVFFITISIPNELLKLTFGQQFLEGAIVWPYIIGLSFVVVLTAYREPFNATMRSLNRPKIIVIIQALFLLINIPLSFTLVSFMGGVGAVIGTAIIEFGLLITYELLAYRYLGGFVFPDLAIEQILSGFVLFMFLKPFALLFPVSNPIFFVVAVGGSILTYIIILSIISQEFRYYLKRFR